MSRSDYLNLNRAYLSNVKQIIKENYCTEKSRTSCTVGDKNGKYIVNYYELKCPPKSFDCSDEYRLGSNCKIGEWSTCVNGNQTRQIIEGTRYGNRCQPNLPTSQPCGETSTPTPSSTTPSCPNNFRWMDKYNKCVSNNARLV